MGIMRATRGRGLVVSSEAGNVLGVRAPADVVNLLAVWGLGRERGMESLGVNPRGVVVNEGMRRSAFRGVVDVIDGGEDGFVRVKKDMQVSGNGPRKKGKDKRKAEEDENEGTPQISKRAAKKAKLKALQEASVSSPVPTPILSNEILLTSEAKISITGNSAANG